MNLGFLICKGEVMISISEYFRKKYKRSECAKESGIQKVPFFSFFFFVKNRTRREKSDIVEVGELWEHEAGKY